VFDVAWPVRVLASVAVVIGGAYLAAWIGGAAPGWSAAGAITMKANMSLALVVAGIALLLSRASTRRARVAGTAASLLLLAIGALTLAEHVFHVDLQIDQILATEPAGAIATASPNRFGVPGAISLTLLGAGLLALFRRRRVSSYLGLATLLVVIVPAVGWLYRIGALYSSARTTGIAWTTVVALSALGVGLMLSEPRDDLPSLLLRDDVGASLLRKFLPVAVLAPLLLGLLISHGERLGLYGSDVADGIMVIAVVVVFAALLWRAAGNLSVSAERRARAQEALRASEERFRAVLENSRDCLYRLNVQTGKFDFVSPAAARIVGYSTGEMMAMTLREALEMVHPDDRAALRDALRLVDETAHAEVEYRQRTRSGEYRWMSNQVTLVADPSGVPLYRYGTLRDVTERRRTEEALREGESTLRGILNAATESIWLFSADGVALAGNRTALERWGRPDDTIIGKHVRDFLPGELGRSRLALIHEVARSGRPIHSEDYRAGIQFEHTYYPVFGADGGVERVAIFSRDITERKRAEEALRASEERLSHYAELVEHAPVLVRDGHDRIVVWNRGMERLYGYSRETALGKVSHDLLQTRFPGSPADVDEELKRSGVWEGELRHRRSDGTEVIVSSRQMLHHDATGAREAVVEVDSDVTALRTAELALLEAAQRKDDFLATLSHELRNPLAPIRNSAYVLRHVSPGSEQARRAGEVIERQAEHLTRLVDDLLDVTRIARGKIELRRTPIDLREVLLRAAEDYRAHLEDQGVAFQTELPDGKVWAEVDATRVTQVIGNLLHNAAKFTRRGDEVRLAMVVVDGTAEIRVRDTGTGIEPALLPQLFGAFVQGERSLARAEGGLGLGLALVKGITELHGGRVSAASAGKGKGAEFVVRLPLVEAQASRQGGRDAAAHRPGCRRILVVDDNVDAAESLADLLRLRGHVAEVAHDGPGALAALAASAPDVILCDIGLPGMSGYDVARTVRAGLHGAVRLIALTGYAQPEDVRRAKDAGFDAHLAKPPDPDELARALWSTLEPIEPLPRIR
jgi:PAS domain S-box-containing protein